METNLLYFGYDFDPFCGLLSREEIISTKQHIKTNEKPVAIRYDVNSQSEIELFDRRLPWSKLAEFEKVTSVNMFWKSRERLLSIKDSRVIGIEETEIAKVNGEPLVSKLASVNLEMDYPMEDVRLILYKTEFSKQWRPLELLHLNTSTCPLCHPLLTKNRHSFQELSYITYQVINKPNKSRTRLQIN